MGFKKWAVVAVAVLALGVVLTPALVGAEDAIFQIRVGENYRQYGNEELRRRVWELEKAVSQLQARIYHLETAPAPAPVIVQQRRERPWTCRVSAFGKTFVKTMESRGEAEALVLQECSSASNEIHCDDIRCSQ